MSETPPAQQQQQQQAQQQQQPQSRFKAPSNLTTSERLSTNTVGLVALSDFRKRRAEVLEQQEREAREALRSASGVNTPATGRSRSGTPSANDGGNGSGSETVQQQSQQRAVKKAKRAKRALVSFGDDEDDDAEETAIVKKPSKQKKKDTDAKNGDEEKTGDESAETSMDGDANGSAGGGSKQGVAKITANASIGIVPRALTKAALRREAAERDALRKEFLLLQETVKNTEIAIPFVFYDGSNTPGGMVRVRKGEFVWVFLDKSRKVGAQLGVGGEKSLNARRDWARVGVDDLLLVRGTIIIPHQYEFYFFIVNKSLGPNNVRLFNYSAEPPIRARSANGTSDNTSSPINALTMAKGGITKSVADINTLEGAKDDPTFTKVVDRRWYERNKHIYPASTWQEFDPEKDYMTEVRKDTGGNTFFYSK
ncbi:XAP5, circadian clock regulator-domain-containing protein [Coniella lustricola]|uniref:XAP5, circadian clock regulator-domain-containing protein n=1 Tax=Coniella lustricola TaxID=2025994 RepID=A0A2T3ANN0_9PEZI|nr:XAP5, circadian clock regulator-domain-containing protein [Coniella lustricola]